MCVFGLGRIIWLVCLLAGGLGLLIFCGWCFYDCVVVCGLSLGWDLGWLQFVGGGYLGDACVCV